MFLFPHVLYQVIFPVSIQHANIARQILLFLTGLGFLAVAAGHQVGDHLPIIIGGIGAGEADKNSQVRCARLSLL